MGHRLIAFGLDAGGLDFAIDTVKRYKEQFIQKCNELISELVEHGILLGKAWIVALDAVDTGALLDGMSGYFNTQTRTGIVFNRKYYAVFVEYGTGVVGSANPHPIPWSYDVNEHGTDGWYYKGGDGKIHWTMGQPSRPFFYRMYTSLKSQAPDYAHRIFGNWD